MVEVELDGADDGRFRGAEDRQTAALAAAQRRSSFTVPTNCCLMVGCFWAEDLARHISAPTTNSLSYEYTLKSKRDERARRGVTRREYVVESAPTSGESVTVRVYGKGGGGGGGCVIEEDGVLKFAVLDSDSKGEGGPWSEDEEGKAGEVRVVNRNPIESPPVLLSGE